MIFIRALALDGWVFYCMMCRRRYDDVAVLLSSFCLKMGSKQICSWAWE